MNAQDTMKKHLIIIVDDVPSNQAYFSDALASFGYSTIMAENGVDALAKIKEVTPDLILTDINMPVMNGYELCEAIKQDPLLTDIPIILVTAQDDRDGLVRGLDLGADDFLIKPVNIHELKSRVRNLLLVKDYRDHMKWYTAELEGQVEKRTNDLNMAFEELKNVNAQLRHATLDTITRLATAAEFRDQETASHIRRMSKYSHLIAKAMNLDDEFVENIIYASPMHDIGKIGTPDHILLKSGSLTADERKIMQDHTIIGEQILVGSDHPLLLMANKIAGSHHEKWDGSGYPRGLSGENIPLPARVVAVADVFDALTTRRVYKSAWTPEVAMDYILKASGAHFDPECVRILFAAKDEVMEVYNFSNAGVTSDAPASE